MGAAFLAHKAAAIGERVLLTRLMTRAEEAEDDAPDNADAAVLRRDATNEELREFFARTPMIEPFSSNLDSIFAMNIDVNKLFVLAQVRGGRRTPRARLASNL